MRCGRQPLADPHFDTRVLNPGYLPEHENHCARCGNCLECYGDEPCGVSELERVFVDGTLGQVTTFLRPKPHALRLA